MTAPRFYLIIRERFDPTMCKPIMLTRADEVTTLVERGSVVLFASNDVAKRDTILMAMRGKIVPVGRVQA